MSAINTLDGLRYHELGPILEHLNSEVEIKNLYRILRVIQPLIASLDARGGLDLLSLDSVGAGTSLIFDNTLPDFFLRSIVAGSQITVTVSADGKEITIASSGAGTHRTSDGAVHTDVAGSATPSEVLGNEQSGYFLTFDKDSPDSRWELSDIRNTGADDTASADKQVGPYNGFFPDTAPNFGATETEAIGGHHRFRMIRTSSTSHLSIAPLSGSNDINISFVESSFNLKNVNDVFYVGGGPLAEFDLLVVDAALRWRNTKPRLEKVMSDVTVSSIAVGEILVNTQAVIADWQNQTLSEAGIIAADGSVPLTADWDVGAFKVTAKQLAADIADGTTPLIVTSTTKVANLNTDTMDAAGTPRDWDAVLHTKQRPLSFVDFVTAGTDAATWLTGAIGHVLTKVATGTPPAESVIYAGQIPTGFSTTPVLKWRFYNDTIQSGGDQKDVLWRVQYNSPGSSGVVSAADTGTPTTTLATDQAQNTIKEESLALSNVAAGDLLNVTISVDSAAGTTLAGDVVLLGVPWIEFVQAGLPDTGAAS